MSRDKSSEVAELQSAEPEKKDRKRKKKTKQNKNIPDLRADSDWRTARGRGVTERRQRRRQQQSAGVRGRRGMVWR